MNHIDTIKYIKNNLEQVILKNNIPSGSKIIEIKDIKSKVYPDMDITLYYDIEHIDNPLLELMLPYIKGKINFNDNGMYIYLENETTSNIPFNAVIYMFSNLDIHAVMDNEIPSIADILNMIDNNVDEYNGTKLIRKAKPSLIDGDMKLRLKEIPYNLMLKKTVTNDFNKLFCLTIDDFNSYDKEFTFNIRNDSKELNIEIQCFLNNKQQIVSVIKNYSTKKYLYTTEFNFSKESYKIYSGEIIKKVISVNVRIMNIIEEEIIIELKKKDFSDIIETINKEYYIDTNEKIFFHGIDNLIFNNSINFYSSEMKRDLLIDGDLIRLAKNLEDNVNLNLIEDGIYFCNNNYGDNLPTVLPKEIIKGLWYIEAKTIGNTKLQTVYDLSDISIVFQRKSIGGLDFCDWLNIYHLEHKHKTNDIIETDNKMFVDKNSIIQWDKNTHKLKFVNILEPVDEIISLPKSTKDNEIQECSLCYVRKIKKYLVFDGKEWINIDDTIINFNESINLDNFLMKGTIIIEKKNINILKQLLSLKYEAKHAIIKVTGNDDYCYQQICVTDIFDDIHEYCRTLIKNGDLNSWITKELCYVGHNHIITDIKESEDNFFMTKTDREKIDTIDKKGNNSVISFINLPAIKDIEDNVFYLVKDTGILYSSDKINNKWIPLSVQSLKNIDNNVGDDTDISAGLVSNKFYLKLKNLLNTNTIQTTKNNSLFYCNDKNKEKIGKNSIDLVIRQNNILDIMGNNSIAIGNDIYNYRNNSVIIGNDISGLLNETVMIGTGLKTEKSFVVFGKYNIDGDYSFIVGNGSKINDVIKHSNLFTVNYDGVFETSEKGGYSIKNGLAENVLLSNGKVLSIYNIYKIIRKLINSEPVGIDNLQTKVVENNEGVMIEQIPIIEESTDSLPSKILNNSLIKRNQDIDNKTFSII